jgi:hypothetical protein
MQFCNAMTSIPQPPLLPHEPQKHKMKTDVHSYPPQIDKTNMCMSAHAAASSGSLVQAIMHC